MALRKFTKKYLSTLYKVVQGENFKNKSRYGKLNLFGVQRDHPPAWVFDFVPNFDIVTISSLMVVYLEPLAAGSGIPEIKVFFLKLLDNSKRDPI